MGYGDIKKEIEKKMSHEPSLMCEAHGCPMKWSVNTETVHRFCSYHAWEHPVKWPGITEELHRIGAWPLDHKHPVDTTKHKGDSRAWAKRLQERDLAGEHLSPIQVQLYKEALRSHLNPTLEEV